MYRLRVLGGFALEGPDGSTAAAPGARRAMAALSVLAVAGDLGCTRERLLALLWPEADERRARRGLRDTLHDLRRTLTAHAIRSAGGLLRLDPSVVDSDVQRFSRALASGDPAAAVHVCGGPLLEGFHLDGAPEFEHWLSAERARLQRLVAEALEGLARSAEGSGAWSEAGRWWSRAVEHDPLNSHLVLRQMRALAAIGDRANAIQVGDAHIRRLRDESGLEPDPSVFAGMERIRRGELPTSPDGEALGPTASTVTGQAKAPLPPGALPEPPGGAGSGTTPAVRPRARGRLAWVAAIAAVVTLVAATQSILRPWSRGAQVRAPRSALAVLPFRDLSPDTSTAYLAIGLHDELLAQLAKVAALRVIAPASVSAYRGAAAPTDRIGQELGVGSIVQASVQVRGNRLRVIAHLVDPVSGTDLWAETYDRSLDDTFSVQSDIARQIVRAVGLTLSRAEAGDLAEVPTASAEAYLLYLQGREYDRRPSDRREDLVIAQHLYERALTLDSSFALAHAALSTVHGRMLFRRYDASATRAALQLQEARTALAIAPELPEARVAMAQTYCCGRYGDRRELQELTAATRYAPNEASLWADISLLHARLGQWDSVEVAFERARRLDPRNASLFQAGGNRLHCQRRYPEAIAMYRRAMVLAPDYVQPHVSLAWSYLLWQGQMDTLRAALAELPDVEPGGGAPRIGVGQVNLLLWERRPDSALALLRTLRDEVWASAEGLEARAATSGTAHLLRGDVGAARAAFDSAATLLDSAVRSSPRDSRVHMARGMAMARLGRREEAWREVRWLERSDGYRNDHNCPDEPEARAMILSVLGATDSAVTAVERLLAGPSRISAHSLRLDPVWDPLRGDARFQALQVRYADPMATARR